MRTVAQADDLDTYLREREALEAGVKPDLAKAILWHDSATRGRTPLSLVYVHGFSASRKDISPVVETLGQGLKANVFFTRLAAHGMTSPDAFATVTPQDWLDDAREALAIGRRIGERTILIGTSTGALLATVVALEDEPVGFDDELAALQERRTARGDGGVAPEPSDIAALVLLSPNFGVRDWRVKFLSGPMGWLLARIVIGRDYSFHPTNAAHAALWTPRFPSHGIVALMDLVNHARRLPLARLRVPTLVLYTDNDTVVDVGAIGARFSEIGATRKRLVNVPGATRHELTGAALAPDTVDTVEREIVKFVASLGIQPTDPP